jgi:ankyrin repeat protein
VQTAIEKGCDINQQDDYGETPLCYACYELENEVLKFLIDSGADLNLANNDGDTAYMIAKSQENEKA